MRCRLIWHMMRAATWPSSYKQHTWHTVSLLNKSLQLFALFFLSCFYASSPFFAGSDVHNTAHCNMVLCLHCCRHFDTYCLYYVLMRVTTLKKYFFLAWSFFFHFQETTFSDTEEIRCITWHSILFVTNRAGPWSFLVSYIQISLPLPLLFLLTSSPQQTSKTGPLCCSLDSVSRL